MNSRTLILSILVALLLVPTTAPVMAQGGVVAVSINAIDTTDFPLVHLYVTATDLDGYPLTGLEASSFEIYENDVQLEVTDAVTTTENMLLAIIIDSSVSFRHKEGDKRRVDYAKDASIELVSPEGGYLDVGDRVAVYAFENGLPVRLVDFTHDHNLAIDQGLVRVDVKGNEKTALLDMVKMAVEAASVIPDVKQKIILIFSDGYDVTSSTTPEEVVRKAGAAHIRLFTVGIGPGLAPDKEKSKLLRFLADGTGGRYIWFRPTTPTGMDEIREFFRVMASYKTQYIISYESRQYKGEPAVRLVARYGGREAHTTTSYSIPPLPPQVDFDNLQPGQVLKGEYEVKIAIYRNQREIDRVEYYVDDEMVYTARDEPFSFFWDTTLLATSPVSPEVHTLRVVVFDVGGYKAEKSIPIAVVALPPTPTPAPPVIITPAPIPTRPATAAEWLAYIFANPTALISVLSLGLALVAMTIAIVVMRRGGMVAVRGFAEEVKRKTRIWRRRTGLFVGASRGPLAFLTVESDMFKGKRFDIMDNVVFLGREEERCDIAFYWDEYISRRHAKIALEGSDFYIWDLKSANGTWVNGRRLPKSVSEGMDINEAVVLRDGDLIQLGPDLRLRFHLTPTVPAPKEAPPPPTPAKGPGGEPPTHIMGAGKKADVDTQVFEGEPEIKGK